jgi:hypothetical protein
MVASQTEERLAAEIDKWGQRIAKELENIETYGTKGAEILVNIKAYVSDSVHFRDRGDLVRSFEAIVWAWAWFEIGVDLGFLKKEYMSIT